MKISEDKSDKQENKSSGRMTAMKFFLLGLVVGFVIAGFWGPCRKAETLKVTTIVTRSAGGDSAKRFSAGGWIEVAVPEYPVIVSARVSERLTRLMVKEGDVVTGGQVLAILYDEDIKLDKDLAEAKLSAVREDLKRMKSGYRKEDVDSREAELQDSLAKLELAKSNYERSRKLDSGVISAEQLDADLSAFNSAQAVYNAQAAQLRKMKAGYRKEDISVAEAKVREMEAFTALAKKKLSYCIIKVPAYAESLKILEIHHKVGDWIEMNMSKGAALFSLYNPSNMQVRVDVTQSNIRFVKVGGKVEVSTEANPEKKYSGTVLRIDPLAELAKNTVTVRIRIDDPDDRLFPEMVAHVTFLAEKQGAVKVTGIMVPGNAIIKDKSGTYVFVEDNGFARRQDVVTDKIIGDRVVVKTGLTSGKRVITSHLSKLDDGQRIEVE
ncbi:efflux RND transporter periplasmic adaptor subunit [Verrucomicrobiota bacterium]